MKVERVLMTGDTVGGVWTFTLELARGLSEKRIEVVLVAFGGKASPSQLAEASAISGVCLLDSGFKLEWMDDPWADVEASGEWLLELARDYCPQVVHLNSFGHGALRWHAPVVVTGHSCVLSWWRAVKNERAPRSWDRYRTLVTETLQNADVVTAPTSAMAAALTEHYGMDPFACRVIPNGMDAAKFRCGVKEPFIFSAGRLWDHAKNVQAIAHIAPELSWPVYVAGESNGAGLETCLNLGHLGASQMADMYARAAIYAMPARYEPFGLSILEAALSGCALVLGDIPSLREIWKDSALFVHPDDSRKLSRTLQSLIDNPNQREYLSRRACERAIGFSADRMSEAYLKTYLNAVALRSIPCVS
jgi:glycogen synthase